MSDEPPVLDNVTVVDSKEGIRSLSVEIPVEEDKKEQKSATTPTSRPTRKRQQTEFFNPLINAAQQPKKSAQKRKKVEASPGGLASRPIEKKATANIDDKIAPLLVEDSPSVKRVFANRSGPCSPGFRLMPIPPTGSSVQTNSLQRPLNPVKLEPTRFVRSLHGSNMSLMRLSNGKLTVVKPADYVIPNPTSAAGAAASATVTVTEKPLNLNDLLNPAFSGRPAPKLEAEVGNFSTRPETPEEISPFVLLPQESVNNCSPVHVNRALKEEDDIVDHAGDDAEAAPALDHEGVGEKEIPDLVAISPMMMHSEADESDPETESRPESALPKALSLGEALKALDKKKERLSMCSNSAISEGPPLDEPAQSSTAAEVATGEPTLMSVLAGLVTSDEPVANFDNQPLKDHICEHADEVGIDGPTIRDPPCANCMHQMPYIRRSLGRLEARLESMVSMVRTLITQQQQPPTTKPSLISGSSLPRLPPHRPLSRMPIGGNPLLMQRHALGGFSTSSEQTEPSSSSPAPLGRPVTAVDGGRMIPMKGIRYAAASSAAPNRNTAGSSAPSYVVKTFGNRQGQERVLSQTVTSNPRVNSMWPANANGPRTKPSFIPHDALKLGEKKDSSMDPAMLATSLFSKPDGESPLVVTSSPRVNNNARDVKLQIARALLLFDGSEFEWQEFWNQAPIAVKTASKGMIVAVLNQLSDDSLLYQEDHTRDLMAPDTVYQKESVKGKWRALKKYGITPERFTSSLTWEYENDGEDDEDEEEDELAAPKEVVTIEDDAD